MSRLGKFGLWLNLALALFFAVLGFGIYVNRMDWKAESKDRQDQLRKLGEAWKTGPFKVEESRAEFAKQEARRPVLDKWEADHIESLRSGKDKPRDLVYNNKGVLQYDAQDLPRLGDVANSANQVINGLASLDALDKEYAELEAKISDMIKKENDLIDEEKQLTIQLNGDGAQKGLRGDLANLLAAEQKSIDRQNYLMPLLYNRQAELEILTKRRQGLDARLRELQGANVTLRP
jgi:hypothetical protein